MICVGESAINRLAERIDDNDPGASAHWRYFHRNFSFANGVLSGLEGFGNITLPQKGLRRVMHQVLAAPYRRTGAGFPDFSRLNAISLDLADRQNRYRDLDFLRQVLTLSFVHSRLTEVFERKSVTSLVIGDGFGVLSSLVLCGYPSARVVLVNLSKTLLVDLIYLRKALPDVGVALVATADDLNVALDRQDIRLIAIEARDYSLLTSVPVDVAFNIASMQEMTIESVSDYFTCMRSAAQGMGPYFYCCNRVEKLLPDGALIRFDEYPWSKADEVLVDELCPWHQRYYALRPPFYRPFDGPVQHRLARLARLATATA